MNTETSMLQVPAPHTQPSVPPLLQRLVDQFGACWVGPDSDAGLLQVPGHCVLFIGGDPVRFPECLDVAVVLPELRKAIGSDFRIAVARPANEDAWGRRYGTTSRPSLVFLRDGHYLSTVSGMRDWDDYVAAVRHALAAPVSRVPGIGIAVVAATSAHCA